MTKKWLVAILSAAAMTFSAGALAQGMMTGFYAGLEIGQADAGGEDDIAWKVLGGYQFHRNVAAEFAYSQLLDVRGTETSAMELVAVGMYPVAPQFSIIGKLGFANVDFEPGGDKTELTFGLGVQYDFTPKIGLRAQWQRYNTDEEIDLFTIGGVWKF
jgi:OOP family OmpA-OmpF porin